MPKGNFVDFATKKHKVLGNFAKIFFHRINGRISHKNIVEDYVPCFGEKYVKRFKKNLNSNEKEILKTEGASIKASYQNIITWRNRFAHEGIIPNTATYDEVKKSYQYGRILIECLDQTMNR